MKEYSKKEMEKKIYTAAVYLRLSKEDGDICDDNRKEESNSITNQKRLIQDFLKGREDIHVFKEYVDGSDKIGLNMGNRKWMNFAWNWADGRFYDIRDDESCVDGISAMIMAVFIFRGYAKG